MPPFFKMKLKFVWKRKEESFLARACLGVCACVCVCVYEYMCLIECAHVHVCVSA